MDATRGTFIPVEELPEVLLNRNIYRHIITIINIVYYRRFILTADNMRFELLRFMTFIILHSGNIGINVARAYARAGFYFTNSENAVCYCCGLCLPGVGLERYDPLYIHRRSAPLCDFIHNRTNNIRFFINNYGHVICYNTVPNTPSSSQGPVPVTEVHEIQEDIPVQRPNRRYNEDVIYINFDSSIPRPNLFMNRHGNVLTRGLIIDIRHGSQQSQTSNSEFDNDSEGLDDMLISLLDHLGVFWRQTESLSSNLNINSVEIDSRSVRIHSNAFSTNISSELSRIVSIDDTSETQAAYSNNSLRAANNRSDAYTSGEETARKEPYFAQLHNHSMRTTPNKELLNTATQSFNDSADEITPKGFETYGKDSNKSQFKRLPRQHAQTSTEDERRSLSSSSSDETRVFSQLQSSKFTSSEYTVQQRNSSSAPVQASFSEEETQSTVCQKITEKENVKVTYPSCVETQENHTVAPVCTSYSNDATCNTACQNSIAEENRKNMKDLSSECIDQHSNDTTAQVDTSLSVEETRSTDSQKITEKENVKGKQTHQSSVCTEHQGNDSCTHVCTSFNEEETSHKPCKNIIEEDSSSECTDMQRNDTLSQICTPSNEETSTNSACQNIAEENNMQENVITITLNTARDDEESKHVHIKDDYEDEGFVHNEQFLPCSRQHGRAAPDDTYSVNGTILEIRKNSSSSTDEDFGDDTTKSDDNVDDPSSERIDQQRNDTSAQIDTSISVEETPSTDNQNIIEKENVKGKQIYQPSVCTEHQGNSSCIHVCTSFNKEETSHMECKNTIEEGNCTVKDPSPCEEIQENDNVEPVCESFEDDETPNTIKLNTNAEENIIDSSSEYTDMQRNDTLSQVCTPSKETSTNSACQNTTEENNMQENVITITLNTARDDEESKHVHIRGDYDDEGFVHNEQFLPCSRQHGRAAPDDTYSVNGTIHEIRKNSSSSTDEDFRDVTTVTKSDDNVNVKDPSSCEEIQENDNIEPVCASFEDDETSNTIKLNINAEENIKDSSPECTQSDTLSQVCTHVNEETATIPVCQNIAEENNVKGNKIIITLNTARDDVESEHVHIKDDYGDERFVHSEQFLSCSRQHGRAAPDYTYSVNGTIREIRKHSSSSTDEDFGDVTSLTKSDDNVNDTVLETPKHIEMSDGGIDVSKKNLTENVITLTGQRRSFADLVCLVDLFGNEQTSNELDNKTETLYPTETTKSEDRAQVSLEIQKDFKSAYEALQKIKDLKTQKNILSKFQTEIDKVLNDEASRKQKQ